MKTFLLISFFFFLVTQWLDSIFFNSSKNVWVSGNYGTIHHTTNGGATFIDEEKIGDVPTELSLSNNYPNPFNPTTKISFSIPEKSFIALKVFDILGNEVASLLNEEKREGYYDVDYNASRLTTEVYFYKIQANSLTQTRKMILLK